mgnify:CR=1 FL=1
MKLSAHHKAQGDDVEWYHPFGERYDRVYCAKVFSFSENYRECINADEVVRGGSGYHISLHNGREVWNEDGRYMQRLPCHIEHTYPDYSLYPDQTKDTAYGFLTRGCPRGCAFCHVASKEGRQSAKVADLSEFWHGQKNIVLCDPNLLACAESENLLAQLVESGAKVDFNQGLDARLITTQKAELLGHVRTNEVHFAWDRMRDKESVLRGLELYARFAKKRPHSHIAVVYVLVNFDTTIEQDLERIYTLRKMGYWAYVMVYDKKHATMEYRRLARWCNNRYIFAVCPRFEEYRTAAKIPAGEGGAGAL